MYKIIDNFISQKYFEMMQNEILDGDHIWKYRDNITKHSSEDPGEESLFDFGFSHEILFEDKKIYSHLHPFMASFYADLLLETDTQNLLRCRLDMTTCTPGDYTHPPHVDFYCPHIASVFYLTDSDGETILYNERANTEEEFYETDFSTLTEMTRVKPKENRMLIFDGTYLHTGQSPSEYKRRVLINTDLV